MSAKEPQHMPEMFKRDGPEGHVPIVRPRPSAAPPPRNRQKPSPDFLTLKKIVMDDDSLSAEQQLNLIDKISELY
jgi:hypothetical protein